MRRGDRASQSVASPAVEREERPLRGCTENARRPKSNRRIEMRVSEEGKGEEGRQESYQFDGDIQVRRRDDLDHSAKGDGMQLPRTD